MLIPVYVNALEPEIEPEIIENGDVFLEVMKKDRAYIKIQSEVAVDTPEKPPYEWVVWEERDIKIDIEKGGKLILARRNIPFGRGVKVVVKNGGELTIKSGYGMSIWEEISEITVESGGVLNNYGNITVSEGARLIIQDGGIYRDIDTAKLYLEAGYSFYHEGDLPCDRGVIIGVPNNKIIFKGEGVKSEEELQTLLSAGYKEIVEMLFLNNMTISKQIVVPDNVFCKIENGITLTVESGGSLTLNGNASVGGDIRILPYGTFILNGSYFGLSDDSDSTTSPQMIIDANGTFKNTEKMHCSSSRGILNNGTIINDGIIENYAHEEDADSPNYNNPIIIENNGIIYNNGTIANMSAITGTGIIKYPEKEKPQPPVHSSVSAGGGVKQDIAVVSRVADTYILGGNDTMVFKNEADISTFRNAYIDGSIVDRANYNLYSGSTIIEFKPEYLNTLSEGLHTLEMQHTTGTGRISFNVSNSESLHVPKTGDANTVIIFALGSIALAATVLISNKKGYLMK